MAKFSHRLRAHGDHRQDKGQGLPDIMPERGRDPGIWLHLPAIEYHDDPAIGSGGHRQLRRHPTSFFHTWVGNPNRLERDPTPAMVFGQAVHKVILEGEPALKREFACEPVDEPNNPLLKNMDDLKRVLKPAGFNVGGTKEELINRVKGAFPDSLIYDEIMGEHARYGRQVLKVHDWKRVELASRHVSMHPDLARAFQGGKSEVSVFWINSLGVRCRCRLDYLRVVPDGQRLIAAVSDLKSFSFWRETPMDIAIERSFQDNRLQAAHYIDGLKAAVRMLRQVGPSVVSDATDEDREWLAELAKCSKIQFSFVWYTASEAPYAGATIHETNDELVDNSRNQCHLNFENFRRYFKAYGHELWVSMDPPRRLASYHDLTPWS